jgi:hypothetical protein
LGQGYEADHLPPFSAKVKNAGAVPALPHSIFTLTLIHLFSMDVIKLEYCKVYFCGAKDHSLFTQSEFRIYF